MSPSGLSWLYSPDPLFSDRPSLTVTDVHEDPNPDAARERETCRLSHGYNETTSKENVASDMFSLRRLWSAIMPVCRPRQYSTVGKSKRRAVFDASTGSSFRGLGQEPDADNNHLTRLKTREHGKCTTPYGDEGSTKRTRTRIRSDASHDQI